MGEEVDFFHLGESSSHLDIFKTILVQAIALTRFKMEVINPFFLSMTKKKENRHSATNKEQF
ncbi:MAG: hypothetical protein SXA11_24970 [Cyanobacteriota bacterium]|nr:hypothetical protein [Cyanobacteriota bacterium]